LILNSLSYIIYFLQKSINTHHALSIWTIIFGKRGIYTGNVAYISILKVCIDDTVTRYRIKVIIGEVRIFTLLERLIEFRQIQEKLVVSTFLVVVELWFIV